MPILFLFILFEAHEVIIDNKKIQITKYSTGGLYFMIGVSPLNSMSWSQNVMPFLKRTSSFQQFFRIASIRNAWAPVLSHQMKMSSDIYSSGKNFKRNLSESLKIGLAMAISATPRIVYSGSLFSFTHISSDSMSKSKNSSAFLQGTYAEPINIKKPKTVSLLVCPFEECASCIEN